MCCLLQAQNFAILTSMSTTPLDDEVREALERCRGNWKQIAVSAKVSHSWISQFVRRKIPNPGYATLTRLREELRRHDSAKAAA